MSNETLVEKVPFNTLEVGCRYESRWGEVWEVIAETDHNRYKFEAKNLSGREISRSFVSNGSWRGGDTQDEDDLIFKLVESGVPSSDEPQDAINPSHYKHNGIETIDYMKAVSTEEEFKGHLRLTAIKYISRLGKKDCPKQEIKKAIWYLNKLLEQYEAENNE